MWDEHGLKLHVSFEPHPLEKIGDERLIGESVEAAAKVGNVELRAWELSKIRNAAALRRGACAVIDSPHRPRLMLGLPDGDGVRGVTMHVLGRDASC